MNGAHLALTASRAAVGSDDAGAEATLSPQVKELGKTNRSFSSLSGGVDTDETRWAKLVTRQSREAIGRPAALSPNWNKMGSISSLQASQAEQAHVCCHEAAPGVLMLMFNNIWQKKKNNLQQETDQSMAATPSGWISGLQQNKEKA